MINSSKGILWYMENNIPIFKERKEGSERVIIFFTGVTGQEQLKKVLELWKK